MPNFVIYEIATGRHHSSACGDREKCVATDAQLAAHLDDNGNSAPLAFKEVNEEWTGNKHQWNAALLKQELRPQKPIAVVSTKDAVGTPKSVFGTEAIKVHVEMISPLTGQIDTQFVGSTVLTIRAGDGRQFPLKLFFVEGVAEEVLAAGALPPGNYDAFGYAFTVVVN